MATGSEQNRMLAERMSAATLERQAREQDGALFIRPWRIYANADHRLRQSKDLDSCSTGPCGCGISPEVK